MLIISETLCKDKFSIKRRIFQTRSYLYGAEILNVLK